MSGRDKLREVSIALVTVLLAIAIVSVSPLAGPAGFVLVALPLLILAAVIRTIGQGNTARSNAVATSVITASFLILVSPWISVIYTVAKNGYHAIYGGFFTNDMRVTAPDAPLNMGGVGHAILGTLLMVLIATLIAMPLGVLSGVYITEIRGRFTTLVRFIVQAMSGVPSIVAGLFVYATFVLFFRTYSGLAGALALAILMIPTVARTSEEVLKLVGEDLRFAAYALGSTQTRNVFKVVLPTVRSGLVTSGVLGVARIAGETAPLLMTAQYFVAMKTNPFKGSIASLPVLIFSFFQSGGDNSVARAWAAALVLLVLVLILFITARTLGSGLRKSR